MSTTAAFVHHVAGVVPAADWLVALTPKAHHELSRSGRNPTVVDDHIDRRALRADLVAYWQWQRGWLRRLDDLYGLDGAALASAQLIVTPLDSVMMAGRVLDATVAALDPHGIEFLGAEAAYPIDPMEHGHLQFWPKLGHRPLAGMLLPSVASAHGARYQAAVRAAQPPMAAGTSPGRRLQAQARAAAARLRNFLTLSPRPDRRTPATVMLWSAGYGAREYARGTRAAGRRLLLMQPSRSGWRITDASGGRFRVVRELPTGRPPPPPPADPTSLLAEVDEWARVPGAGELLRGRLDAFVARACAPVAAGSRLIEPALSAERVQVVAAANPSTVTEFATLLAAARMSGVSRELVMHGDGLSPAGYQLITELQNFDVALTADPSFAADLLAIAHRLGVDPPRVRVESPRLTDFRSRIRRPCAAWRQLPICYLPTMFIGDSYVAGGSYFDDAWYHRWQRRLLRLMADSADFEFVWKAIPDSNQSEDPIPALLAEMRLPNVRYETRPFRDVLASVGGVVVDYGSTGLYEAIAAEHPVLGVVFPKFADVRPAARALIGPILRFCEDEQAGVAAVLAFLRDDPDRWVLPSTTLGASR